MLDLSLIEFRTNTGVVMHAGDGDWIEDLLANHEHLFLYCAAPPIKRKRPEDRTTDAQREDRESRLARFASRTCHLSVDERTLYARLSGRTFDFVLLNTTYEPHEASELLSLWTPRVHQGGMVVLRVRGETPVPGVVSGGWLHVPGANSAEKLGERVS